MIIARTARRPFSCLIVTGSLPVASMLPPPLTARAAATPRFPFTVRNVTMVARLIGASSKRDAAHTRLPATAMNPTTRWGICGGDLGSLLYDHGTAYIALGDNYAACPPGTGSPGDVQPGDWRSNAVGIIPNSTDFAHGLHITRWISADGAHAAEVILTQHDAGDCQAREQAGCEVTAIPTCGFATQDHLFLAYMSVHHWGDPAVWDVNYSSFAMSADRGKTWATERNRIQWGPRSNFAQMAVAADPDGSHLLFYGILAGRFGAVTLMRAPNAWQAVVSAHAYQYFAGTDAAGQPHWSADPASAAVVAGAPVGGLSVIFDQGLNVWLMAYLQGGNGGVFKSSDNLVIRSAPHYWGPWSQPAALVTHQQFPGLYGAFMNQHFFGEEGHALYFVMSQWGSHSVFWMKASLQ